MDVSIIPILGIVSGVLIVGIIFGTIGQIVKRAMEHRHELERLRYGVNSKGASVNNEAIEALRREIVQLRDTTTQYDMSVERTLNDLKSRVASLESRMPGQNGWKAASQDDSTESETVTLRAGGG